MGTKAAHVFLGVVLALAAIAPGAHAAEFRVNTFTLDNQEVPRIATIGGGFVTVWTSRGQDGSGYGIYAQRFAKDGARAGKEFRVNTHTLADQRQPAVAGLSGGGFVIVWSSNHGDASFDIFAQRYTATGVKQGVESRLNTFVAGDQRAPAVAALLSNAFVVVWASDGQDGSGNGVYGQRFAANGAKAGKEFRVNTFTAGNQSGPAVSRIGSGSGFVVAWASFQQDGESYGVYAQRFSDSGAKAGGEFRVNVSTPGSQSAPAIARLQNGSFVIAFSSEKVQGDVLMQRYSATGTKLGTVVRVNTYTALDQEAPSVTAIGSDRFVVIWSSYKQEAATAGRGIYGQRYSLAGARVGVEFRLNERTALDQEHPSVAPWSAKGFVAVWDSELQDGSETGVYGKRYTQ